MAGQFYPLAPGERNPQQIVNAIRDLQQRSGSSWLNNVQIITGSGTLQPTANGATVLLGGNAFYDYTIPAVSTMPTSFVCLLENNDTTRGKRINVTGPSDIPAQFILWPKQSLFLFSTGKTGTWHSSPDVNKGGLRWKFDAATTFFINPSLGDNTNDGLATGAGAFKTLSGGYSVITNATDFNGFDNVMKLDDGTYTDGLFVGSGWTGGGTLTVVGNQTTPDNVFVSLTAAGSTGGSCFIINAYPGGAITIASLKMKTTVGTSFGVFVNTNSLVRVHDLTFDTVTGSHLFGGVTGSQIQFSGPIKIIGSPGLSFVSINAGSFLNANNQTITLVRGGGGLVPDFPQGFVAASNVSVASVQNMTFKNDNNHTRQTTTGNTHSNTTLDALGINTSNLDVGMPVLGPPDIPANTTIAAILGANSVQLSNAATGTTGGLQVKFEIATNFKYNVQVSSTVYSGTVGPDQDYLPGNKAGIAALNGVYL